MLRRGQMFTSCTRERGWESGQERRRSWQHSPLNASPLCPACRRVLYADAGRALLALRALRLEFKGTGDMPTATTLRLQKLYILAGPAILLYPAEVAADVSKHAHFRPTGL